VLAKNVFWGSKIPSDTRIGLVTKLIICVPVFNS